MEGSFIWQEIYKDFQKTVDIAEDLSKKGEFPVACALVYNNEILVTSAMENSEYNSLSELHHAEIIALHKMCDLKQSIKRSDIILFCTLEPCLMCYVTIIHAGIENIVYGYEDVMGGGTGLDIKSLTPLYSSKKINIHPHVLRDECLSLYKSFFSTPDEDYLKGSLLAEYTFKQ